MMLPESVLRYTIRKKNSNFVQLQKRADQDFAARPGPDPYLLYMHIPFCRQLCPYCSFHRVPYQQKQAALYFEALRGELAAYSKRGFTFSDIYVGGGTPTVDLGELAETLSRARDLFPISKVSVETNPDHLTPAGIEALKTMGIHRVSVGVQSLNDTVLDKMGRRKIHGSSSQILDMLKGARGQFNTLNVDMIFNVPGQTLDMLHREIDQLLDLEIDQVTFYPLMTYQAGKKAPTGAWGKVDNRKEKMYYREILKRVGAKMAPSTVWCFSKTDAMIDEYIVSHDEYVGVGSGAFGYLNGTMFANTFSLDKYAADMKAGKSPIALTGTFPHKERLRYDFVMRLFNGSLDIDAMEKKYAGDFYRIMWRDILLFKGIGALKEESRHLILTRKGMYYWLVMMRAFFENVNAFRDLCRKMS